jgi:hypothetical protein
MASYLAHLGRLTAGAEPRFLPIASTRPDMKAITVMIHRQMPDDLTASITYGKRLPGN